MDPAKVEPPAEQTTDASVKASLSIVIPTLNEAGNIGRVVQSLSELRDERQDCEIEVICVDDDSTDGTAGVVREMQATRPWLKLVERKGDRDLSRSVVAGWQVARGEWLGVMDGDLQHPAATWKEMLRSMTEGNVELVMASRFVVGASTEGFAVHRGLISWTMISLAGLLLGAALPPLTDPMSGLFAVRRSRVNLELLAPRGYKILLEVLVRCGINSVRELPVLFGTRGAGSSKLSTRVGLLYVLQVLLLCWRRGRWWILPLSFVTICAVAWMLM